MTTQLTLGDALAQEGMARATTASCPDADPRFRGISMIFLAEQVEQRRATAHRMGECLIPEGMSLDYYHEIRVGKLRIGLHRAVASLKLGFVPLPEFPACHACDVRACFEESHVRIKTTAFNSREMYERSRHPANRLRGEQRPTHRLNEDMVRAFRKRARRGERISDIARSCGLAHSVAYAAIRGISWAHVQDVPPVPASRKNKVGSQNAHVVARPELVLAAGEAMEANRSLRQIAQLLSVSRQTAFALCRSYKAMSGDI